MNVVHPTGVSRVVATDLKKISKVYHKVLTKITHVIDLYHREEAYKWKHEL